MTVHLDRRRIYQVFDQALGIEPAARPAFLDQTCANDASLRSEVEALLTVAARDPELTTSLQGSPVAIPEQLIGREFGRFRLVEFLGEGGMGIVFRAERTDGVQQSVAIKLLGSQLALAGQARFEREAQLLARLEHPAVARLIDAGVEAGRGWIALEFIKGQPIDDYCESRQLSIRERVKLMVQLVDAVAAAHRMLVVHRDIKPANVLINAEGLPKLIDFGIATALQDGPTAARMPTVDVGKLFTPNFAAPEQVTGEPVTVATDVFGLGALAYRLLTGRVPYPEATTPIAYVLAISRHDVEVPSRAAGAGGAEPKEVQALRGDLDAILMRALERDPARRYPTAMDLRGDLQRYLDDLPVLARPPSLAYRLGKFTRRNTLAVGLCALLGMGLLVGGLLYSRQARSVAQARSMAARRGEFLESVLRSADPHWGSRDITVAQLLDKTVEQLHGHLSQEPLVEASMLQLAAETYEGLGRFKEALDTGAQALALLRAHGGGAVEIAGALVTRGEVLTQLGTTALAEAPLREAVAILQETPAAVRPMASALTELGVVLTNTAREKEAEGVYLRAIDLYQKAGAPLAARAGFPQGDLSVLLGNQGHYQEAAAMALESMENLKKLLPPDHPDLLAIQMNYASTLANLHRAKEAEQLFRQLIDARIRVLGPEHKDTLIAQYELADDLAEQHRDLEAAEVGLPTAEALNRTLGPDNPFTLGAWGAYGNSACRSGQGELGLPALRRVEEARVKVYGATDWHTLSTRVSIGGCLAMLHHYAEAEPVLLSAVAGLEKDRGPGFHRTQAAYQSLADMYAAQGRADEAAGWKSKVLP